MIRVSVLTFAGALAAALAVSAQQMRGPSAAIVYGDASRSWLADKERFAALLDARDGAVIVAGGAASALSEDAPPVWFGDLAHDRAGLAPGETRLGADCCTRRIDRIGGFPRTAATFSSEDPQGFCRGVTISHVLLGAGRWMRNDGTGCLARDCAAIVFGGRN